MMVLGLGCNLTDRLTTLRLALQCIKNIPSLSVLQVSPVYVSDALLPENAPAEWDIPYFNLAIRCETTLSPKELLQHTKSIERQLGRTPLAKWGPRIIDIDILAWNEEVIQNENLSIPHPELIKRPFALWPLADVAPFWLHPLENKVAFELVAKWGSRFSGEAPFHTKQILHRVDTPQLVGILNVTPDSFSDGSCYLAPASALDQARYLIQSGAEIIDIGAEATGPNAKLLAPEEEWQRLEPVLSAIHASCRDFFLLPKISIDTRHPTVASKALALGVDWINDVSGLTNPALCEILAEAECDIVVMHNLGIPANAAKVLPSATLASQQVYQWAEQHFAALEKKGIDRNRLIFDPGIGFGKTKEQSLEILKNTQLFKGLGVRQLIGHSRKSFLTLFTDKPAAERDIETLSLSLALCPQSVDYLRVHNVEMCARGLKVMGDFSSCKP